MKPKKLSAAISHFLATSVIFLATFTLLRVYEFNVVRHKIQNALALEWAGYLNDWPFACRIVATVLVLYAAVSFIHVRAARYLAFGLYLIFISVSFCLIQYFSVPLTPLSADVFAYSMADIRQTMLSSDGVSWTAIISLLLYGSAFTGGVVWTSRSGLAAKIPLSFAVPSLLIVIAAGLFCRAPHTERYGSEHEYVLTTNKAHYFIEKTVQVVQAKNQETIAVPSYPFLKKVDYKDVLGPLLQKRSQAPDIVIIIVEGLGSDFIQGGPYAGFTPFLDSLSSKGLYWSNTLSNAGRTFGALPSLLGSLPYGTSGFMNYGANMPDHQTLISLLKTAGYETNFFHGGNAHFDNQDIFLERQGIDYLLDQSKFPDNVKKDAPGDGSSWGYADREVFDHSLQRLDRPHRDPRLNIYLTLSTHEPFRVPEQKYADRFDDIINSAGWAKGQQDVYQKHKEIFSCLLYTDDVLRQFFRNYAQRPEYHNTIFLVTGDHRLVPVPQHTRLSRFEVPLIVFSPLQKTSQEFSSLALHSDITPTLLAYMTSQHGTDFPEKMPFISDGLPVTNEPSSLDLALIRTKGEIDDYIEGDWLLSEDRLYHILPDLKLAPTENAAVRARLRQKLTLFKQKSAFACTNNQVDMIQTRNNQIRFDTRRQHVLREENAEAKTAEEIFARARALASEREFFRSRTLLHFVLNTNPNYHDARTLLGTTYGWEGNYDSARLYIRQVLQRNPLYLDAYVALADVEYWAGQNAEARAVAESGLTLSVGDPDLLTRKARSLWLSGERTLARQQVGAVLARFPTHPLALDLNKKMTNENL